MSNVNIGTNVANDAHLVQLVCGLGRGAATRGFSRPNISSCKFVVTLHGCARTLEERRAFEGIVRRVSAVHGVVNKILVF